MIDHVRNEMFCFVFVQDVYHVKTHNRFLETRAEVGGVAFLIDSVRVWPTFTPGLVSLMSRAIHTLRRFVRTANDYFMMRRHCHVCHTVYYLCLCLCLSPSLSFANHFDII